MSDNGTEYTTFEFENLANFGIKHQFTVSYSPQDNGVLEKEKQNIDENGSLFAI